VIVFDLRCQPGGEVFEGWFASSADYAEQIDRGLVQCPFCGSSKVEKAPMAPRVSGTGDASARQAMTDWAELQDKLLSNSEWVGEQLPETARAMHLGEVERRPIHGKATMEETKSLIDEGIPLLPLPLPIVPPGQVN
jgi:hypothetical protein